MVDKKEKTILFWRAFAFGLFMIVTLSYICISCSMYVPNVSQFVIGFVLVVFGLIDECTTESVIQKKMCARNVEPTYSARKKFLRDCATDEKHLEPCVLLIMEHKTIVAMISATMGAILCVTASFDITSLNVYLNSGVSKRMFVMILIVIGFVGILVCGADEYANISSLRRLSESKYFTLGLLSGEAIAEKGVAPAPADGVVSADAPADVINSVIDSAVDGKVEESKEE